MAEADPTALCFAGFTLDPDARTLMDAEGREVPLRRSEYELLRAFLAAPGRALSRDHLLDAVAGRGSEPFDRSVDVLVGRLRRKLEPEPGEPRLIVTVPGVGYRFTAKPQPVSAESATVLAPVPSPAPPASPERRQLTILHCGLRGPALLAARRDPEDLQRLLVAFHARCAAIIHDAGGTVAKRLGETALGYFGYPETHEDAAERAIRAALRLLEAASEIEPGHPGALQVRVGIATGLVLVGDLLGAGAGEPAVVGEAPALAAGLLASAEPGTALIGSTTRRLVGDTFQYREHAPIPLDGVTAPVPAWQVIGEGVYSRFEALRGQAVAELVGREEELSLLLRRWAQAKAGTGRVVLIMGEPGIGKSRLVRAVQERLDGEAPWQMRYFCSPHHRYSALYPVIAQLEAVAGFGRDDTADTKFAKLRALLAKSEATEEAVALLAGLLSIPADERYRLPEMSPQKLRERTLEAVLGVFAGLAAREPVLVIFEDVHWIDPSSLDLVARTVERAASMRVLLLITARPEFRPPWSDQAHGSTLLLNRLSDDGAAMLAQHVAGQVLLHSAVVRQIVQHAEGVPLFVEELTKAVLESGALTGGGGAALLRVPTSLHDLLLARLDRLGPARELAQIGAVIGREFTHQLLSAVAGQPDTLLERSLRQLVRSELLFPGGTPPDVRYSFKHVLVQQAAYDSLSKGRRQQLHARIAEELERGLPHTVASRPEVLAHHLTEAGLAERALAFWDKAGSLALARSAPQEAAAHLGRALRLAATLSPSKALKRRELELQAGLSTALSLARGLAAPEVEQAQLRARELAAELGDGEGWFRAQWGLWHVHSGRAQTRRALGAAQELLAAAEQDGDGGHLLQAHHALWTSLLFRGEFAATRTHAEAGRALYDPDRHRGHIFLYGDHDPCGCALTQGGNALWFLGHPEQAQRWHDEALGLSERLGLPQVLAHTLNLTAIRAQLGGDLPRLEAQVRRVTRLAAEHGFANWFPEARILAGWLAARRDRDRAALGPMRDHMERRGGTGTMFAHTWLWLVLADACLAVGANAEAIAAAREGLAGAEATEERFCEAELHRVHAAALLARDRTLLADAERALATAVEAARGRGARMSELRAAIGLARLRAERGARHDAHDLLAPVYAWFTEGFDTPDLRDAKALLDTIP